MSRVSMWTLDPAVGRYRPVMARLKSVHNLRGRRSTQALGVADRHLHEPDSPPTYLENKECALES